MRAKTGNGWPHDVTKKDLEISFCRASGKGGQNVNKRDTACRIKHIPTGIQVFSQEHRTAERNRETSWKKLCDILVPIMLKEINKENFEDGKSLEVVRTYKEKNDRVIDHRNGKIYSYKRTLEGKDLEKIVEDLKLEE